MNDSRTGKYDVTSLASVKTDRAARYGKQLTSHLGHKITSTWDDQTRTGSLVFPSGVAEVAAGEDSLKFILRALAPEVTSIESAIGRHLVRFGKRDELIVRWRRSDGTPGSIQGEPEETSE